MDSEKNCKEKQNKKGEASKEPDNGASPVSPKIKINGSQKNASKPFMNPYGNLIVGVCSLIGAGKTTACEFFRKKGFSFVSLSDIIRDELRLEGSEITRDRLREKGNEMRKLFGPDILARRAIMGSSDSPRSFSERKVVIDSIRNPSEVAFLKTIPGFTLISILLDPRKRFERIMSRKRESEGSLSYEEFIAQEQKENSSDETAQQLQKVIEMADISIENNSGFEEFNKNLEIAYETAIVRFSKAFRLDWDEYFLKMCVIVAERSTCLRRHVGAIAVRNRQILTTGYCGAPSRVRDCLDFGFCYKNRLNLSSGGGYELCKSVHAEQNAIIQAASHGVSLEGATLYCTHCPCTICGKMIVNAGIRRVVSFDTSFPDDKTIGLFSEAGVAYEKKPVPNLIVSTLF
ncbi:MAG TPA: hypothetical protein ENN46_04855 [Candidatus Woesearchaeota archaeon]|nr:hypothetical protein [Candidatus Woesearchaeota archaeon]